MTTKTDDLQERVGAVLMELAAQRPAEALSIITGCFVSLVVAFVDAKDEDPQKEIKINGGDQRDITIHAAKGQS
uniref:hypothetical protein n=1 Tax=Castellaniella defragrans TaxID=75697 RepID=UPI00333EE9E3